MRRARRGTHRRPGVVVQVGRRREGELHGALLHQLQHHFVGQAEDGVAVHSDEQLVFAQSGTPAACVPGWISWMWTRLPEYSVGILGLGEDHAERRRVRKPRLGLHVLLQPPHELMRLVRLARAEAPRRRAPGRRHPGQQVAPAHRAVARSGPCALGAGRWADTALSPRSLADADATWARG